VLAGSLLLFSDRFGNRLFCELLSKWVLRESGTGVLRLRDVTHSRTDGSPPDLILKDRPRPDQAVSLFPDPEIDRSSLVYRVKDNVTFSLVVEEFDELAPGGWRPFVASDMQVEFVMMDAYIRKTLHSDSSGRHEASFQIPDVYGVFKFRVLYRRPGLSVLHTETTVSVRPFKHDEFDRFIPAAYPYYLSALSALAAFTIFCLVFTLQS
jgi:oligosaccharyltransferase complex subunit beta